MLELVRPPSIDYLLISLHRSHCHYFGCFAVALVPYLMKSQCILPCGRGAVAASSCVHLMILWWLWVFKMVIYSLHPWWWPYLIFMCIYRLVFTLYTCARGKVIGLSVCRRRCRRCPQKTAKFTSSVAYLVAMFICCEVVRIGFAGEVHCLFTTRLPLYTFGYFNLASV